MPSDLTTREQAVLDVLRNSVGGINTFGQLAVASALAREVVAALDRLDAPCSECGGSGKVAEVAPAYMRSTYRCVSCGGTGNEEATDGE